MCSEFSLDTDVDLIKPIPLGVRKRYEGHRAIYHGDKQLLKPTGIEITTISLLGSTTRENQELIVKTMSLDTNSVSTIN